MSVLSCSRLILILPELSVSENGFQIEARWVAHLENEQIRAWFRDFNLKTFLSQK